MAVHTPLSRPALENFLKGCDLGNLIAYEGIASGIENSNFHVFTDQGRFVLTLFEKRAPEKDLPYFMDFMAHLAAKGIPCPAPITMRDKKIIGHLAGKPAVMLKFMPGKSLINATSDDCRKIGALLADMHIAAKDFIPARENTMALDAWEKLIDAAQEKALSMKDVIPRLEQELLHLKKNWPKALPKGAIHADLFPDNILFDETGNVSGVLDFYFAATDFFIYDLMLTFNAWCFDAGGKFQPENAKDLMAGYEDKRALSGEEKKYLPLMGRAAAVRIISTRLYDWFFTPPDSIVTRKDPLPYMRILEFHREKS